MVTFSRLPSTLSGSVCVAILALAGCSSSALSSHAGNSAPTTPSASAPAPSTAASGPAVSSAPAPSTAASSPAVSSAPAPSTGTPSSAPGTGWLTVTVSGLPADPVLVFGGQPAKFTVTLRNGSGSTYREITPLVSIGHCTCSTSGAEPAPAGTLAELDPSTGTWRTVVYDREGTGMDWLLGNVVQQPPFTLVPGATASFAFQLALAPTADQLPTEHTGQTSIDVTIVTVPSRKVIGKTLLTPITVTKPAT